MEQVTGELTVYALGYEDYTYDFQATEENSVADTGKRQKPVRSKQLKKQKS